MSTVIYLSRATRLWVGIWECLAGDILQVNLQFPTFGRQKTGLKPLRVSHKFGTSLGMVQKGTQGKPTWSPQFGETRILEVSQGFMSLIRLGAPSS